MAYSMRQVTPRAHLKDGGICLLPTTKRKKFLNFFRFEKGNCSSRDRAYQETAYLAAMRRALCSSDSRRGLLADFELDLVSVVVAGLVSVVVVVAAVVVVVVAAGAVAWTGAAAAAAGVA